MSFKISSRSFSKRGVWGSIVMMFLVGVFALWSSRHAVAQPSHDAVAEPVAGVAKVTREDLFKEVKYLAEFRPYERWNCMPKCPAMSARCMWILATR